MASRIDSKVHISGVVSFIDSNMNILYSASLIDSNLHISSVSRHRDRKKEKEILRKKKNVEKKKRKDVDNYCLNKNLSFFF